MQVHFAVVSRTQPSCVANTNHWDHHRVFEQTRRQSMTQQGVLRRDDISEFISKMYDSPQPVILGAAQSARYCKGLPFFGAWRGFAVKHRGAPEPAPGARSNLCRLGPARNFRVSDTQTLSSLPRRRACDGVKREAAPKGSVQTAHCARRRQQLIGLSDDRLQQDRVRTRPCQYAQADEQAEQRAGNRVRLQSAIDLARLLAPAAPGRGTGLRASRTPRRYGP